MLLGLALSSVVAAQVNPEEGAPTEPFPEEVHPHPLTDIQILY